MTIPAPTITEITAGSIPFIAFHSVQEINGTAYTFSGRRFDGAPADWARQECYKFDADTGTLLDTLSLPYKASHSDVKVLDGNIAISIGGMGAIGTQFVALRRVQALNLDTNVTISDDLLPFGAYDVDTIKLDGSNVFFYGGHERGPTTTTSHPSYQAGIVSWNGSSLSIEVLETLIRRCYATAHRISANEIMIIGGIDYSSQDHVRNTGLIEIFDLQSKKSRPFGVLNNPRRYHSSQLVGDKIYVFGGTDLHAMGRGQAISSIESIDLVTGAITELQDIAYPRYHMQSGSVNYEDKDYLIFFGGQSNDNVPENHLELYDVGTESSIICAEISPSLDHDRISWVKDNRFSIFGGQDASDMLGTNKLVHIDFATAAICSKT